MSETVEAGKDAKDKDPKAEPAGKGSPEEMLKQAVGAALGDRTASAPETASAEAVVAAKPDPARRRVRLGANGRLAAAASVALVCGLSVGLTAAPRENSGEALAQVRAGLEAGRAESARLAQDIERLARTTSALREASEAARGEAKALGGGLTERMGRIEQALDRRLAALSETITQAQREQGARIAGFATQLERKAPVTAVAPPKTEPKAPDPVQTGSLPDKPKSEPRSETVEGWAVRDVYDGVAVLEDRRRRLVEVGAGDTVPGVGRVEAVERRGRNWVVVTRQGLITPQAW